MSQLIEYKCPCCDGAITFDSGSQKMKCPFCDTEFDVETLRSYDESLKGDKPDEMEWESSPYAEWRESEEENVRIYVCETCGGEVVAERTTAAASCPYCGNPVIMKGNLSGVLRPDFVIPFKLDKQAAKRGLEQHLRGKKLLPKVFKDQNHIDEIRGVYVPFWLFSADADADIRYRATRIRHWSDSNYNYTETSHFSVFRAGDLSFEQVPVDGSSKMPDDLMESIEPFDFSEAVDFQTAYLAGYLADKYDVDRDASIGRANDRIKRSTEQAFAETVRGYATVIPENSNIALRNGAARYALYPVWLLNTTWQGKTYTFAMNGQTGKFVGDLPVDKKAAAGWFWGLMLGIGAACFLLGGLLLGWFF